MEQNKKTLGIALVNLPIIGAYDGSMDLSDIKSTSPSIGLLQLSAILRQAGFKTTLIDNRYPSKEEIMDNQHFLFTSMSLNINHTIEFSKQLREIGKLTVLGGSHATAEPESVRPYFDQIVEKEGEPFLCDFYGIPDYDLSDLDSLPFPSYDSIDLMDYRLSPFGTNSRNSCGLVTSRGCYGRCNFCSRNVFGNRIRKNSAKYVYDLMRWINDLSGITDFLFFDDIFVCDHRRLEQFCSSNSRPHFTWSCCARVDGVSLDKLKMMKESGCHMIEFGIESGSQTILDLMGKGITIGQIEDAVRWAKQIGIKTKGNFILGYLGETHETIKETISFASRLPLSYAQHTFYTPLPGTVDWERASEFGFHKKSFDHCNTFKINFIPEGMTEDALWDYSVKFYRAFYLRYNQLSKLIFDNPRRLINGLKAFRKVAFRQSSES